MNTEGTDEVIAGMDTPAPMPTVGELANALNMAIAEMGALRELNAAHVATNFELIKRIDVMRALAQSIVTEHHNLMRLVINRITSGGSHAMRNEDVIAAVHEITDVAPGINNTFSDLERVAKGQKTGVGADMSDLPF